MVIVDRNSFAYRCGRFAGKVVIFVGGFIVGKILFSKKPLDDFPEKSNLNIIHRYIAYSEGYQLSWLERTPDKGEVSGSNPEWPSGGIAQLVEHRLCTAVVSGSNPLTSTRKNKIFQNSLKFKELRVYGEYLGIQKR